MDLVLDGEGPRYAQLARALRQAMVTGRIADGARIPPSRDLATRTGLSRTTVVAAYRRLEAEGLLEARVGDGSYARVPGEPRVRRRGRAVACPPQSAFARRARAACAVQPTEGERDDGVRFSFRYDALQLNSTLPDDWARLAARAAPYVRQSHPSTQGSPRLREEIAIHARTSRGLDCRAEDVLIVNGARQAYALATRVVVDAGEPVAIEDPHYFGIRRVLQAEGADLFGVPVDDDGMQVEGLRHRRAKAVFVMPSHQFPQGGVLAPDRRNALLEYAHRHGAWIIEDDFGGEFRHGEPAVPALHSLDAGEQVIHVGSFSRTLGAAIRLGYVVMPKALREDFIAAKSLSDFGVSPYEQETLAQFLSSGAYARHLRQCASVLAERRLRLRQALDAPSFPGVRVTGRNAGMHLVGWLDGIDGLDMRRLLVEARRRGLGVESIAPCYLRPPPQQALMLGFGCLHAAEIPAAVATLAECLDAIRAR